MITFDFQVGGQAPAEPFLDGYELEMLFAQTRADLERALTRKLAGVSCAEHHQDPQIQVRGTYDFETEQMDIQYNIESCCAKFRLQVVQIISRVG